jgi:hypothetical protein
MPSTAAAAGDGSDDAYDQWQLQMLFEQQHTQQQQQMGGRCWRLRQLRLGWCGKGDSGGSSTAARHCNAAAAAAVLLRM